MLLELMNKTPWAILPATLEEICTIIERHSSGKKLTKEDIENAIAAQKEERFARISALSEAGVKLKGTRESYVLKDGIAVIPVYGTISKRLSWIQEVSTGGVSTQLLKRDIKIALNDEDIEAIVLDIESPGGTVDGTKEISDLLYKNRGKKPILAYANGLMASAAYYIGSGADSIYAYDTAQVGSVGVVIAHYDFSEQEKKMGVKRTFITAGEYKRVANSSEPLDEKGKNYLQSMVDSYYSLFVDDVARNLGETTEKVLSDIANGRIFIAGDALKIGAIDAIGTFDDVIEEARKRVREKESKKGAKASSETFQKGGNEIMPKTVAELSEKYPDLVAQIKEEAISGATAENAKLQKQNAALSSEVKTLRETVSTQGEQIDTLIKKEEKRAALEQEAKIAATANSIWDAALADSDVPVHLHSKVKKMVSHSKFVSEDGSLDTEAFGTAVNAEIATWKTESPVQGTGTSRPDSRVMKETKEDDDWVEEMASLVGEEVSA